MKTTITLSDQQLLAVAEDFAKTVHAAVVFMQLRAAWGHHPNDKGPCPYHPFPGDGFKQMQAAIRSIKDPVKRRIFVRHIRHYFLKLREEHRTDAKWQDFVALVDKNAAEIRADQARLAEFNQRGEETVTTLPEAA